MANKFQSAYPISPSEILKEEIEFRKISQRELAKQMGISYSVLNELLNGRRPITERTALMFEAVLGVEAEPILRMQLDYNLRTMRQDNIFSVQLAALRKIAASLF